MLSIDEVRYLNMGKDWKDQAVFILRLWGKPELNLYWWIVVWYFCYSEDEFITSVVEFTVEKIQNNRHSEAVRRLLCLSQECLIERDIQTYNTVTLRPLTDITALIRCDVNTQLFTIEYADGNSRTYLTTNRYQLSVEYI